MGQVTFSRVTEPIDTSPKPITFKPIASPQDNTIPKVEAPAKMPDANKMLKSGLGKAWDWANTSLVGVDAPTPQEFFDHPSIRLAERAGVAGLTTPLAIGGEVLGGIGLLGKRLGMFGKGAEEVSKLDKDIPKVSLGNEIPKDIELPANNPLKPKYKINKDGTFTDINTGNIVNSKGEDVSAYPEGLRTSKGKVKITFSKVGEDTTPTLPKDLQGAKPRYNIQGSSYSPKFDSDLDKAAYITAQINPSKRDADYLKFVMDATGLDENGARNLGKQVKEHVKASIKNHIKSGGAEGDFTVPKFGKEKEPFNVDLNTGEDTAPTSPQNINVNSGEMPNVKTPDELRASSNEPPNEPPPKDGDNFSWGEWWNNRSRAGKFKDVAGDASRSMQVGFDLGWPLRQGRKLLGSHPKIWSNASLSGAKAFGSEKYFDGVINELQAHPQFKEFIDSGGDFTHLGSKVAEREELYRSPLAENLGDIPVVKDIPIVGKGLKLVSKGVSASERASTLAGDVARFNTWLDVTKDKNVDKKAAAELVNTLTGRANLPGKALRQASPALNQVLYSPRLIYSNFKFLNPYTYAKAPAGIGKEYVKAALGMITTTVAVNKLAEAAGAEVTWNPTSSDFGKIKIGKTRIDMGGGIFQNLVLLSRLGINQKTLKNFSEGKFKVTQETTSAAGKTTELDKSFGKGSFDVVTDFGRSKASPLAGAIINSVTGEDTVGNETNPLKEVGKMYTPFLAQDFIDTVKENPELAPFITAISAAGASTQTFNNTKGGKGKYSVKMPKVKF